MNEWEGESQAWEKAGRGEEGLLVQEDQHGHFLGGWVETEPWMGLWLDLMCYLFGDEMYGAHWNWMSFLWQGKLDLPCQIGVKERCAFLGMLLYQDCRKNTRRKIWRILRSYLGWQLEGALKSIWHNSNKMAALHRPTPPCNDCILLILFTTSWLTWGTQSFYWVTLINQKNQCSSNLVSLRITMLSYLIDQL